MSVIMSAQHKTIKILTLYKTIVVVVVVVAVVVVVVIVVAVPRCLIYLILFVNNINTEIPSSTCEAGLNGAQLLLMLHVFLPV